MHEYDYYGVGIWEHIKVTPGESVIIRHAFRWRLNGQIIENSYERDPLEKVLKDNAFKLVRKLNDHIAIIERKEK